MFVAVWFFFGDAYTHWLIVALVSERLYALTSPFAARRMASARKAFALCILVAVFVGSLQVCTLNLSKN